MPILKATMCVDGKVIRTTWTSMRLLNTSLPIVVCLLMSCALMWTRPFTRRF